MAVIKSAADDLKLLSKKNLQQLRLGIRAYEWCAAIRGNKRNLELVCLFAGLDAGRLKSYAEKNYKDAYIEAVKLEAIKTKESRIQRQAPEMADLQ